MGFRRVFRASRSCRMYLDLGIRESVTMAESDPFRYLTEPLAEIAQHHLTRDETVLTAIYLPRDVDTAIEGGSWFLRWKRVQRPTRAFVLTTQRVLVVEDPTDAATSTASGGYLLASCPLDRIMHFELRAYILDCALTLTMAAQHGPERVTVPYSGVVADAFLAAVAYMRAVIDGLPLPSGERPDESARRERDHALQEWYLALAGLELGQQNIVMRYLVAGELVREWLGVPAKDESRWWQRLSIGAHEQPSLVVVRTDRQLLLVREARRIVRGQATYGNDSILMPRQRLQTVSLVSRQRGAEMQFTLEHLGVTTAVHSPIPLEHAERAMTLATSSLAIR
jgi:hypothetical protein